MAAYQVIAGVWRESGNCWKKKGGQCNTVPNKPKFKATLWSQPETLELAYKSISSSLNACSLPLWLKGETVGIIAMGASSHSAHTLTAALTLAGVRSINLTASDLKDAPDDFQPADHYVLVSESGRSPEIIESGRNLIKGRRISITAFPEEAICQVTDFPINLGGFPDSRVYVVGYNATLMAYSLLLGRTGLASVAGNVDNIPPLVRQALSDFKDTAKIIAEKLSGITSIDFVGHSYSYASAAESALVFREAVRLPATAFDTFQYLHGPMQSGKKGTGLFVFGDGREIPMLKTQIDAGVAVTLVTTASDAAIYKALGSPPDNLTIVRLPEGVRGFARAILEVVLIQLVACAAAEISGNIIENYIYRQSDTKLPEEVKLS
jgi:fructoselysine-6-P-deglycase FrlB-like protein